MFFRPVLPTIQKEVEDLEPVNLQKLFRFNHNLKFTRKEELLGS